MDDASFIPELILKCVVETVSEDALLGRYQRERMVCIAPRNLSIQPIRECGTRHR